MSFVMSLPGVGTVPAAPISNHRARTIQSIEAESASPTYFRRRLLPTEKAPTHPNDAGTDDTEASFILLPLGRWTQVTDLKSVVVGCVGLVLHPVVDHVLIQEMRE